ncbi:Acyl-CoA synthetase (AMP-forming)/AMP-acid ligase II [Burkholderia sp. YR290]|uniref:AMP-binding protein n=1 Tax=Paraburkholderia hospita TaxID=169430 RepID=UPI0009D4FA66|nr:AMP-binding protein [Paraburkholderia hospita]SKD02167.1 Acyl-CoA synthetase (AMP-forming)/AMP-acid ligase II [Paraburkholderia hospita]SOE83724.1 Acyl-CoA synthetase (AMP-forming)/AMP-acid ligase II [Burkholderia sp. YR290]
MTSNVMETIDRPFREVGFREPTVEIERRGDGTLILKSGPPLPPTRACTTDWLEHWVTVRPASPMLVQRNHEGAWESWSVGEVWDAIRSLATALHRHGASQDAPLAVLSENSSAQALITWGALYAGVPIAPVSPAYSLLGGEGNYKRLSDAVSLVKPHLVFVEDARRFAGALDALGVPPERVIAVEHAAPGMLSFASLVKTPIDPDVEARHRELPGDLAAKYMFTSGSTGMPKAVVQSRSNLAAAQEMTARVFKKDPEDQPEYLEWLPWHHVMGGNIVLNRILRFGATLYIDDGKPLPGRFDQTLKNLADVAPSLYFNVPAGLAMLLAALERDERFAQHFFSRLKYVYYGGAVLSRDLYDRFQQIAVRTTGERVVLTSVFGATESSGPAVTQYWAVDDVGCIGLPVSDVTLKLLEDPNLPGRYEMRIKGPNIIERYLDAPDKTAAAFDEEGFYMLGDAVRFVDPERPVAGLRFAGRFAEDFKLANGTWVRTAALRTRLIDACSPLVREAVISHDGADTIGTLAWPDVGACAKILPELAGLDADELVRHPLLLQELERRLAAVNAGQKGASMRIERLMLLEEPPSMQHYELTDKGSINQRAVNERRRDCVDALFAAPCRKHVVVSPA